jgi:hypothetical protein
MTREVLAMFLSSHKPCAECGESVERTAADAHTCDPTRRLEFQMLALGPQISAFEMELRDYLSSNEGAFQMWLASRDVRRDR